MKRLKTPVIAAGWPLALIVLAGSIALTPQPAAMAFPPPSPAFTYQGVLKNNGTPVNGTADVQFSLWDQASGGSMLVGPVQVNGLTLTDGQITASVNFGTAQFAGEERWLQIDVKAPSSGGAGPWQPLSSRQRFAPVPYALHALSIGGVQPGQLSLTNTANNYTGSGLNIDGGTLFVDPVNNRVGIGTSTPQTGLEIQGAGYPGAFLMTHAVGGNGDSGMRLARDGGTYWHMFNASGNGDAFELRNAAFSTVLTATQIGRVGIGTTAPIAVLDIFNDPAGGTLNTAVFRSPGVGPNISHIHHAGNGDWYIRSAASAGKVILQDSGGNVGIGTDNPTERLGVYSTATDTMRLWGPAQFGWDARFRFQDDIGNVYLHNDADGSLRINVNEALGGRLALTGGRVGVGTTAPTGGQLHVVNSFGDGTFSESSVMNGRGVFGYGSASTPLSYGVYGQSNSSQGIGVFGDGSRGGYFQSSSTVGRGVVGLNTAATGSPSGVYGECSANQGAGVVGFGTGTGALSYGGVFQAVSTIGEGVYGFASHVSGASKGVHGHAISGHASSYGVYATGKIGASGTKSFRIDHPDDPANKYLVHYSAESDEVINFYSGKVTLNGAGEALVDLPAYFSKINRDPRYTLTAIGAPMPSLHIADEISDAMLAAEGPCWFRIAGGVPGAKVSWRVEAVRNDAFVKAYGAPVEVDKPEHERGKYQHPELYGQPSSAGLNAGIAEIFKNHADPLEPLPINREVAKPMETRP